MGKAKHHIAEVQGIRAIAVGIVLLFHARFEFLEGGFIGVDVFFVVSGYLITGLLQREWVSFGKIDLVQFYARRAKRLLPAAILVTLVTLLVFSKVYAPFEFKMLTSTGVATLAYLSNVWFAMKSTDYLGGNAESDPLLHTWSLGIEEQFYLFWPLFLILLWRFSTRRTFATVLTSVLILSFVSSIFITKYIQPWGFFLLPTRVWEFGFGAIIPLLKIPRFKSSLSTEIAGFCGLVLILGSAILYTKFTLFPGWAAIPPVLGTLMLLLAAESEYSSTTKSILKIKFFQFTGDISYSLYLWHWPVFVLLYDVTDEPAFVLVFGALILCYFLASLSYFLIENPMRHSRVTMTKSLVVAGTGSVVAIGLVFIMRILSIQGINTPEQQGYLDARNDSHGFLAEDACYTQYLDTDVKQCDYGDGKKKVVLFGDSHAAHWFHTLNALREKYDYTIYPVLKSACPGIDIMPYDDNLGRKYVECSEWRKKAFDYIQELSPDLIVLGNSHHYWEEHLRAINFSSQSWEQALASTLQQLPEKENLSVLMMADNPKAPFSVPECLSRKSYFSDGMFTRRCDFIAENQTLTDVVRRSGVAVSQFPNVSLVDLNNIICPAGICKSERDGYVIYFDNNHISGTFGTFLSGEFEGYLERIGF